MSKIVLFLLDKIVVLLLLAITFVVGYAMAGGRLTALWQATPAKVETSSPQPKPVEVWTCSMHPQIQRPGPGKCPLCNMDLIRLEAPAPEKEKAPGEPGKKGPRYACAMFCVPPLEKPGKCPMCGMEMMAVEEEANTWELQLSERARKLAEIQTAPVERKAVSAEIRMVGKVVYDETRIFHVVVLADGVIERLYANYVGIPIKKGDHLADFYSPQVLAAAQDLLIAHQTGVTIAGGDILQSARRKMQLLGVTDEQIDQIGKSGKVEKTFTIYSPVSGTMRSMGGRQGQWLSTGQSLCELVDISQMWVLLDAYESDIAFIHYGQRIDLTVETLPGRTFESYVSFIPPELDDSRRSIKVRLVVPNLEGLLRPGMFVRAQLSMPVTADGVAIAPDMAGKWICPMHPEIVGTQAAQCDICQMALVRAEELGYVTARNGGLPLVIPASAPLITGKRAVVYVTVPGKEGLYRGREIILGPRCGDYYLVREGLREGEYVVVNGNFKIDSAVQIRAKPSMMNPPAKSTLKSEEAPTFAGTRPDPRKQVFCPVTGEKIDPSVYLDYKGKRIYFCCASCNEKLLKEPQKFLQKLAEQGIILEDTPKPPSRRRPIKPPVKPDGQQTPAPNTGAPEEKTPAQNAIPQVTASQLDAAFASYLEMHRSLSRDDFAAAQKEAPKFLSLLQGLETQMAKTSVAQTWPGVVKSAQNLAVAQTIAAARVEFSPLSEGLIRVAKALGSGSKPLLLFHCPMAFEDKGAHWLQTGPTPENPYFGAEMFQCGRQVETLPISTK